MRRLIAALSSAALALGVLVGVAAPASAATATPASVSMDYSGGSYALSADEVSGGAGDTFTFTNNVNQTLYLRNAAGSIRVGATTCTSTDCPVSDSGGSVTVTIVSTGVIQVVGSSTWTITLVGGDASTSSPTDPALVYPTLNLNANGGTCTGQMQFTKYNGQNGTVTLPTGDTCTRAGYTLSGWARADNATESAFASGSTVPIGDESFALYAVWSPTGVEVTYDANVGANDQCLASGIPTDVRTSTSVVAVGSATATSAPCNPPNMVLAGWALTGDGDVAVQPGGALPADWTSGSSHRLYAKWKVTYGVSITSAPSTMAPNSSSSLTVLVQDNDSPASYVAVGARAAGPVAFGDPTASPFGSTFRTLGVAVDGTATIPIYSGEAGTGTITVFYGNSSSSVTIRVAEPVVKAITLTGERATVSGKPGIRVEGTTTGFAVGEKVVPWIKFPGQTSYSQGTARPVVDADGKFSWQRKTGKKIYVYFRNEDGSVKSDRIIIQAK